MSLTDGEFKVTEPRILNGTDDNDVRKVSEGQ